MGKSGTSIFGFSSLMDALDFDASGTASYVVGSNVEYAVYVEFGTSSQQAQPYLRPAVERAVRKLDTVVEDADSTDEIAEALALQVEREAKELVPVDSGNLKGSIEAEKL